MVWTATKYWNVGDSAVSPELNTYSRDNLAYLKGDATYTAFTFQNGWSNFGGSFSLAGYIRKGDYVYLRGLIKGTSASANVGVGKCATLPVGYRPTLRRIFSQWSSAPAPMRVDVLNTGEIWPGTGGEGIPNGTVVADMTLDGIHFEADGL